MSSRVVVNKPVVGQLQQVKLLTDNYRCRDTDNLALDKGYDSCSECMLGIAANPVELMSHGLFQPHEIRSFSKPLHPGLSPL